MIALVLVSHSRALALALKDTLEKLYGDKTPPLAVAAGAGKNGEKLGTDATVIMAAIEAAATTAEGVLVLLDLGSAVLSTEMALDLLDEAVRDKVSLCSAPLVEGAIAAAALISVGASLAAVRAEAEGALRQKIEHLGSASAVGSSAPARPEESVDGPSAAATLRVDNPHGLHARPAMRIVQTVALFSSAVQIENLRSGAAAADARSLVAINCLDARVGDMIRVTARGADAAEAVRALEALHVSQFGDLSEESVKPTPRAEVEEFTAEPPPAAGDSYPRGKPLSEGIALGILSFATRATPVLPPPAAPADAPAELARLHRALISVQRHLDESARVLEAKLGQGHSAILQAHRMLVGDPALVGRAEAFIRDDRTTAAHAWQKASALTAESYRRLEQPLLRERAQDIEDLGLRVLRALGVADGSLRLDLPDSPCVLAVPILLPSEVTALDVNRVRGVLSEAIGGTSHAAILLRAMGVAAVDGVDLARLRKAAGAATGLEVALDGATGEIWLAPDEDTRRGLEARQRRLATPVSTPASHHPPTPLHTRDGRRVELAANVSSVFEAAAAARAGAEAIGLLRTEFFFFDRSEPPSEDEQTEVLQRIAAEMPPDAPVTVRTFDIGGDKPVLYLPVPPEANPFLGIRGLRLALVHRPLFLVHLRAVLRAAHRRRFRVMFPMVTEVAEVHQARALLVEAHDGLVRTKTAHAWPVEVGMMVEVPAAALNAQHFVSEVDFFSLGTNDLTQYTLAAERGHARLTDFADALHPAVLRLVKRVADIGTRHNKWVGVCGEAAADPVSSEVFVGLGVQELSVGTAALGRLRQAIRLADYRQSRERTRHCFRAASAAEVRLRWVQNCADTVPLGS